MPQYSIDPTELQSEISALPITCNPLPSPADKQLTQADQCLVSEIFPQLIEGSSDAIRTLKGLIKRYPEVPSLKSHLCAAYQRAGRSRQSEKIVDLLRRENPDYLFGHLNYAGSLVDNPKSRQRIPEILGETLRLRDFKPDVTLFHESEVLGYYNIVAHFHLEEGRPDSAMAICKQLLAFPSYDDSQLQTLLAKIAQANFKSMQQRIADDEARAIRTVVAPIPRIAPNITAPEFHHPEIAALYQHKFEMPRATIAEILALPRTTLIADLETVLQDSIARAPHFISEFEDEEDKGSFFALHAIYFLGELKAAEALPTVFDAISLHKDGLDYWYGDLLQEDLWEPLLHLVEGQLDVVREFMLKPGIPSEGRAALATAVARLAVFQPARRAEVRDWFRSVLEFLLDSPPEDNVLDTRLVTDLIWQIADLHATELLPLIALHYDKDYVFESSVGTLEDLTESMNGSPSTKGHFKLMRLEARYRDKEAPHVPNRPPPALGAEGWEDDFEPEPQTPAAAPALEVGRNDPCPCDSGKKYKKCCL